MSERKPFTDAEKRRMRADVMRDFDLLLSGWRPSAEFLRRNAVFLGDWRIVTDENIGMTIVGSCEHPRLPKGFAQTSHIVWAVWEGDRGYVRSECYWYLLGKPDERGYSLPFLYMEEALR